MSKMGRLNAAWLSAMATTVIMSLPNTAQSRIVLVPDSAATIQGGLTAALEGDTVLVSPGLYIENLYIGITVTLMSSGGPTVTILEPADPDASTITVNIYVGGTAEFSGFTVAGGEFSRVINITGNRPIRITGNIFRDHYSVLPNALSIRCECAQPPLIEGNLFYHNTSTACIGVLSGSATIRNNTFDANSRGFTSSSAGTIAVNNIVSLSSGYGINGSYALQDYNCVFANGDDYSGAAIPGAHSLAVDPLYCDTAARNYDLTGESPCIGSGLDISYIGAFPPGCDESIPFVLNLRLIDSGDMQHIVSHTPPISWDYHHPIGLPLVETDIEVGTDSNWIVAEMWTVAGHAGPDTSITYAGLTPMDGSTYYVRVRVNDGTLWSSWYQRAFRMNTPPGQPIPNSPIDGNGVSPLCASLSVVNPSDAEVDSLSFLFVYYGDSALSVTVDSIPAIPAQPGLITQSPLLCCVLDDSTYWWRARAFDGLEWSDWSEAVPFSTRGPVTMIVPSQFATIQAAVAGACVNDTIQVLPGLYSENLSIEYPVVLISSDGPEVTIIEPANPDANIITMIIDSGGPATLSGFTVAGGSYYQAVKITGGQPSRVIGNIFRDFYSSRANAVSIRCESAQHLIESNLFLHNVAISSIGVISGSPTIRNNTFHANRRGFFSQSAGTIAVNNIVSNSTDYAIHGTFAMQDYNCVYANGDDYSGAAYAGVHSIAVDPMYCDTAVGDHRIDSISPCVGTGLGGANMGALPVGCIDCDCPCMGDPQCDGVIVNILDVVRAVDVAFRGVAPTFDILCPGARTDVNCNGATEVFDVVKFIDVAFRSANPATAFCDSCSP